MPVREALADGEPKADMVMEPDPVRLGEGLELMLIKGEDVVITLPVPDEQ